MNVYMFASFGRFDELPAGGGQTSARRMMATLNQIGINVFPFNRHHPIQSWIFCKKINIYLWAILDLILFGCSLLFRTRKNAIVLFIGYSGAMLLMETAIGIISKILGFKVIFYLKGGGTKQLYDSGSRFYRFSFRNTMKLYDDVFVEGEENSLFLQSISKTNVFYMPNFTEYGFAPNELPIKPKDKINIVYFGRISKEKNIVLAIDIFDELCKKYNNIVFNIIGNSEDDYGELVKERIIKSKKVDCINKIEKLSHDDLKLILKDQHIFLFPSNEPREGHSNALNEAMSWGVVPVVSNNNYLPSIVGNKDLVANDYEVKTYVKIVSKLIDERKLLDYSRFVYERVKLNFTQDVVEKRLKEELKNVKRWQK